MTQVRRGLLAVLLRMGELGDPQGSPRAGQEGLEYSPGEPGAGRSGPPVPTPVTLSPEKGHAVQLWGPQGRPRECGGRASPGSHPSAACGRQRPLVAASMPLRPPRDLPS